MAKIFEITRIHLPISKKLTELIRAFVTSYFQVLKIYFHTFSQFRSELFVLRNTILHLITKYIKSWNLKCNAATD